MASGKHAWGISDRSGFRYKLKDMRTEWDGTRVGPDEYEEKHPQLEPRPVPPDEEALRDPAPDPDKNIVYVSVGNSVFPPVSPAGPMQMSLGHVTVTTS